MRDECTGSGCFRILFSAPIRWSASTVRAPHCPRGGHMARRLLVALASTPAALIGCHAPDDLPSDPPTSVTEIASGGFQSPTDAVASPDGRTFYFAAWDMDQQPALFQVAAEPGSIPRALATGDPL